MQEETPERKRAGSITGKGRSMVVTLTLIYPIVLISFGALLIMPIFHLIFKF